MHRRIHRHRGFSIIEFMIVAVMLGILAAIAIPRFLKHQALSKQGEAKANLKAWFSAQRAYHQDTGRYSESVHTVGFLPERGNRYAYYFSFGNTCIIRQASGVADFPNANCVSIDTAEFPGPLMPVAFPPYSLAFQGAGADPGMPGLGGCLTGTGCNISGLAAGNTDDDPMYDTWWISTKDAISIQARCGNNENVNAAGEPYLVYNDEVCDN